jgi:glycosyltransferase involved in cell wall biosynthesis
MEILVVYNTIDKKKSTKSKDRNIFPKNPWRNIPLRCLIAPSKGVNHARNTGLLAARGEVLLFIDDDCLMTDTNYLQKIKQKHRELPQLQALGGPYKLSAKASFWDRAYHHNMHYWLEDQRLNTTASRALLGGNASYKKDVFSTELRFTPGIKYGGSETPLNTAVFEKFGPLGFDEELALEHQSQMGLRDFAYKAYMQGKGYAWQSKMRPQQIQKSFELSPALGLRLRASLRLYSFLFMVGFRTSILERTSPLRSFSEELFIYLRQPFLKFYQSLRKSFSLAGARHGS